MIKSIDNGGEGLKQITNSENFADSIIIHAEPFTILPKFFKTGSLQGSTAKIIPDLA